MALGFGLAHLPSSGSSSSGSESMAGSALAPSAVHAGGTKGAAASGSHAYTLPAAAARHILGKFYPPMSSGLKLDGLTTYRVEVPATVYDYYAVKLRRAQARAFGTATSSVIIRLFRAHHSGTP